MLRHLQQVIEQALGAPVAVRYAALGGFKLLPAPAAVHAIVVALRDEFGVATTAQLLRSCPEVLRGAAPADVRANLELLAIACACDWQALLRQAAKNPTGCALLVLPPWEAEVLLATLRECLGLGANERLPSSCLNAGKLLGMAPADIRSRRGELGVALGLAAGALDAVLQRNPALLATPPETVQAVVAAVKEGLDMGSWEEAVRVTSGFPRRCWVAPEYMLDVLRWLKRGLGLSTAQAQRAMVVCHVPVPVLEERLQQLPAALGIPPGEALALAQAAPRLLMARPAVVAEAWEVLKQAARLQGQWRAQLLAFPLATFGRLLPINVRVVRMRILQIVAAAPPPERLPSLRVVATKPTAQFSTALDKVRAGTFRRVKRARQSAALPLAEALPGMAAQLQGRGDHGQRSPEG